MSLNPRFVSVGERSGVRSNDFVLAEQPFALWLVALCSLEMFPLSPCPTQRKFLKSVFSRRP